ncbi:hypothetical protein [Phenylobacterium montanum]|uniref:Uncharacterized protein n=1 Tax=Phenylobacterium montanum TaxID=2823693 RepID=A0A975FVH7_9CAUL|nr:hypothetical protein [Caulobacter sp. S6]QUD86065.1 hypothetical protein KCG34_13215 [Caulobacter sp. S6]
MASFSELFRLAGGVVALGLIVAVVAVTLVFQAPDHWREGARSPKSPQDRPREPV